MKVIFIIITITIFIIIIIIIIMIISQNFISKLLEFKMWWADIFVTSIQHKYWILILKKKLTWEKAEKSQREEQKDTWYFHGAS